MTLLLYVVPVCTGIDSSMIRYCTNYMKRARTDIMEDFLALGGKIWKK